MKFNVFIALVCAVFCSAEVINETKICTHSSEKSAGDFTSVFLLNRINEKLSSTGTVIDNVLKKLDNIDSRLIKLEMDNKLITVRMENIEKNIDFLKILLYSSKYPDHDCSSKQAEVIFKNTLAAVTKSDNNETLGNTVEIPPINCSSSSSTNLTTVFLELLNSHNYPRDCFEIQQLFGNKSRVYKIQPKHAQNPISVYCDHSVGRGGWTVIQNRFDGSVDFYRSWNEYKKGFGDPLGEYWLGLEYIQQLTNDKNNEIYFLLEDFNNDTAYAHYDSFSIGTESQNYKVTALGTYEGTAGDSFRDVKKFDLSFSTHDRDNDKTTINCANIFLSGWWYKDCSDCNLNGIYMKTPQLDSMNRGVQWSSYNGFYYSLKSTRIMIRPRIKTPL